MVYGIFSTIISLNMVFLKGNSLYGSHALCKRKQFNMDVAIVLIKNRKLRFIQPLEMRRKLGRHIALFIKASF